MTERQNKATPASINLAYTSFFDSRASRVKPASLDYSLAVRRHYDELIARYFPGDAANYLHMGLTEYIPLIPLHIIKNLYAYMDALDDGLAAASKRIGSHTNALSWLLERLEALDTCLPPQAEHVVRILHDVHYTLDRYFDKLGEAGSPKVAEIAAQIKKDLKPLFLAIENRQRAAMRRQIITILDQAKTLDGAIRTKTAALAASKAKKAAKPREAAADEPKTGSAKAAPKRAQAKPAARPASSANPVSRPKKFMQEQLNTFVEYMKGRTFDGNRPMLNLYARDCWLEHKRSWDKAATLMREDVGKGYGRFYDLATAYWGWLGRHRQPVPEMK